MLARSLLLCVILALVVLHPVNATFGFDAIQAITATQFTCLRGRGYQFFIGRIWQSNGNADNVGIQNIKTARTYGWIYVDAHIFPCLTARCAPAYDQVKAAIDNVRQNNAQIGGIWIDVAKRSYWSSNHTANQQIVLDMVRAANETGFHAGIFTNALDWMDIVGVEWSAVSSHSLWWGDFNGDLGFDRFVPFGGWTTGAIHQFAGNVYSGCGVNLDENYY